MPDQPILNYPFNPKVPPQQQETIPLEEVILQAIDNVLLDTHTWMPASVTKVINGSFVNIQPQLQRVYTAGNGSAVTLKEIQNVMIGCLSGMDYWIKPPVAVGDEGIALFCERSLDNYAVQGGITDPQSARHHSMTDPIFIPGLRPRSNPLPIPGTPTDMVLHNGLGEIYIQKSGKFRITNGSQELFANIISALQTLAGASTVVGGPFIPSVVTALEEVISALQTLQGS
jgi:hypothetical protein